MHPTVRTAADWQSKFLVYNLLAKSLICAIFFPFNLLRDEFATLLNNRKIIHILFCPAQVEWPSDAQ